MEKAQILVTEDEGIVALDLKRALEDLGYTVPAVVSSGEEAIIRVEETCPDLVLMDIMLAGDMDGVEAAEQIRARFGIPVIFLTANADERMLERAKRAEPFGYIIKPFKGREVRVTIEMALHKRELEEELRTYREHLEELVEERTGEVKKANEQFLESQKMESVGRLAGGIAHDFNNLLTPIISFAQLGMEKLPQGDDLRVNFEEIRKAAVRASDLTRQLLAFSRPQVIEPKVLNLNNVLINMDKILRRILGEDIELVTLPSHPLDQVEADPGQIEQVILNLAVNARDAMPSGGKLTLETTNITVDEAYLLQHDDASLRPQVMLSVTDTGSGMSEEVKSRIFEPFFTTKEEGKGTGLGLPTCLGIATQSGGHIEVHSELGQGTTFKLFLPSTESAIQVLEGSDESSELLLGTETVLLVEDEWSVRNLVAEVLRFRGYTVLEAANGLEALEMAEKQPSAKEIDLLLTDIVMPLMGGMELAEKFTTRHPNSSVLFVSGYGNDASISLGGHGGQGPNISFIPKPFLPEALSRKVREVLDSKIPDPNPRLG